jgi:hypothetical protein
MDLMSGQIFSCRDLKSYGVRSTGSVILILAPDRAGGDNILRFTGRVMVWEAVAVHDDPRHCMTLADIDG